MITSKVKYSVSVVTLLDDNINVIIQPNNIIFAVKLTFLFLVYLTGPKQTTSLKDLNFSNSP
jgi:hypothetical protein